MSNSINAMTAATKAKVSGSVQALGLTTTIMAYLSDNKDAITALSAMGGFACTVIATFFTIYYLKKNYEIRKREQLHREKMYKQEKKAEKAVKIKKNQ